MKLKDTQKNWHKFGKTDPLFAILTYKDKKGGKWNETDFFQTGKEEIARITGYLKSLRINLKHEKALDFGCGVGRLTQALAAQYKEIIGIDCAPSMIKLAEKYNRHSGNCKYFLNTTNDLKLFPDKNFDFILTKITLQHMEPQYAKNYIKEFLRILAPEGILIFQIPSEPTKIQEKITVRTKIKNILPLFMVKIYRLIKYKFRPIIEMYGIKREEMIKFLEENGAKIIDIQPDNNAGDKWISYQYCVTIK